MTSKKSSPKNKQTFHIMYQAIFENAPIGIFQSTPQGRFQRVNPFMARMFGYDSPEEMIASVTNISRQIYVNASDWDEFQRFLAEHGEILEFIGENRRKDGTVIWTQTTARAEKDAQENILYYEGFIMDITVQKQAEDALQQMFDDLEQRVEQRTDELTRVNAELRTEIAERKQTEDALAQQNDVLSKLNHFSIELSMLSSEDNLEAFIARQIKDITGAMVAMFNEYNPNNRTTTTKHIEMEPGLLEKAVGLLGKQVNNIHSVVSDEMYREMTTEIIGMRRTLYEISFGAVSRPVGAAIEALLKIDRFIGIAYLIEGKLYGTSILAMSVDQPDPPKKMLESFVSLAAVSLRRKQAESELRRAKDEIETAHRELQQSFAREQQLARTDELTGINNHHFLLRLAEHEFNVAMRYRPPLSMVFFDIDDFKLINDNFGHLIGDRALKKIVQVVCAEIRSADVIGRYGGDEFVILLPQTSAREALPFAERLHASVAAMRLKTNKGALTLTISIGIAQTIHHPVSSKPGHNAQPDTVENLLLRADQAMYAAKQAGKNRTVIFDSK